ncbi:glycoside hydrolase family 13 protein [Lentithecium fluviatile CBS 122367]|uniref:Glycoside hydrolase family 13 protein n=1 Tax=Lentithecium fluviatile CBS 122367 TaxID=1168545 RepID=A0A6G1IKJ6_9PLEO|nr:glycoside hydrolase family 13 protein [Lentithecium fluviatile CBS 122367]
MHDNPTIFQSFEWNLPAEQKHYQRLLGVLPKLHSLGVNALWLPPACKAGNSTGNGYDIYDLYDLGEFDQRGSRATKWGPKEDLVALAAKAKELDVGLYFDAVFNHRCGGDTKETVHAVEVDPKNRCKDLCRPKEVEVWLRLHFAGRDGEYSSLQYDWRMFNASDWDDRSHKPGIYKIVDGGKCWAKDVSKEWGNGDYLIFNNLDYTNKELREDVKNWGVWVVEHLGLAGFRLDAMQHFSQRFSTNWIKHVRRNVNCDIFVVGEYWNGDVDILTDFLKGSPSDLYLYDAPLLYNLAHLSWSKSPDLRTVFERTLVKARPHNAVTLVMNHDTQKGQVMDTPVHPAFTSLAYALILFREAGYPCVFYGDLYGISKPFPSPPTCGGKLADLILARKLYAYGEQHDYFQDAHCIGWVRRGLSRGGTSRAAGMAVVMSWAGDNTGRPNHKQSSLKRPSWLRRLSSLTEKFGKVRGGSHHYHKKMDVGAQHAGEVWADVLGGSLGKVTIDHGGYGMFPCQRNSVAIYVSESAEGRERFPVNFESNIGD